MNDRASLRAVVVGAGIGGMSAALMLARKGFTVTVLEQAPALGEVGAGLQLSPNASRVLIGLGLGEALSAMAFRPEAVEGRTWKLGVKVSHIPLGKAVEARFGAPYLHVHRADLLDVLAGAVARETAVELRLGTTCSDCESRESGASLIADGEAITADLVVGADGIRSVVRRALFGPAEPRFTGNVAWRGVIPAAGLHEQGVRPVAGLWMGPGAHFVHYYLRGGSLMNFVGVVERGDWREESWSARGSPADLRADFAGWHDTVRTIVERAPPEGCFRWALFDRDPLPCWSLGVTTLLGDACHPTLPFMAQGACMAIEDAAVLAECVAGVGRTQIPEALKRYETLRKPRTTAIQTGSRANAGLYHLRAPKSWMRNLAMRRGGQGLAAQAEALYGYDAVSLARSPTE